MVLYASQIYQNGRMLLTFIPHDIPVVAVSDRPAGEIATKDNDFWNEAVLDAIIEHLSKTNESEWVVEPYVR